MTQLLLDLFNHEVDFNDFIATGNEITLASLQSFSSQFTHIYGEHLSGKTHLLKAWVNLANSKYHNALYLEANQLKLGALNELSLDYFRFIALDNIEHLDEELQIELFDLFNHIKLNNRDNYLLTSSGANLHTLNLRADLKTRIQSGLVLGVKSLSDADLLHALTIYTKREGIKIGENELKYILSHYPRNLGELIGLINGLSQQALREKKAITIPLIKGQHKEKNA
jgi:DnaA family protein